MLKWVTGGNLLYSTWNSIQCYVPPWIGEEFGEEWIHTYIHTLYVWKAESFHCSPETTTTLLISYLLLLFSLSVVSDSLWPHRLQHAKFPCLLLSPGVCSNSCPLSWWCHPAISSSAIPFSSWSAILQYKIV